MKNYRFAQDAKLTEEHFDLDYSHDYDSTRVVMSLRSAHVTTKKLPYTYSILKSYLPSILHSTCFNGSNLPFHVELRDTQIGHLFEHILLEYLSYYKTLESGSRKLYNGTTSWDWKGMGYGVFHIEIDSGIKENRIFKKALENSVFLINEILSSPNKKGAESDVGYLLLSKKD